MIYGIKCKKCGSLIYSYHRHDFKWCSCKTIFIDGGDNYLRCGGNFKYLIDGPVWCDEYSITDITRSKWKTKRINS